MISEANTFEPNGKWMPLRFLYFVYYVFCRRDKMHAPDADKPAITASYGLIFLIGQPILAALALLNHFTGWVAAGAQVWLVMHLPGDRYNAPAYAFASIVGVVDIVLYKVIFSKKRYEWIMHEFNVYDPTQRTIAPAILLLLPFVPISMVCLYSYSHPVLGNLIVWSMFIVIEVMFRLWWNRWCWRNAQSGASG